MFFKAFILVIILVVSLSSHIVFVQEDNSLGKTNIAIHKIYVNHPLGRVIRAIDINNDGIKELISCYTNKGAKNTITIYLIDLAHNTSRILYSSKPVKNIGTCIDAVPIRNGIAVLAYNGTHGIIVINRENTVKVLTNNYLTKILSQTHILASAQGDYDEDNSNELLLYYIIKSSRHCIALIDLETMDHRELDLSIVLNSMLKGKDYVLKWAIPIDLNRNGKKSLLTLIMYGEKEKTLLYRTVMLLNIYVEDMNIRYSVLANYTAHSLGLNRIADAVIASVRGKPLLMVYGYTEAKPKVIIIWNNSIHSIECTEITPYTLISSTMMGAAITGMTSDNLLVIGPLKSHELSVIVVNLNNNIAKEYLFPKQYVRSTKLIDTLLNIDYDEQEEYVVLAYDFYNQTLYLMRMDLITLNVSSVLELTLNEPQELSGGKAIDIDYDCDKEIVFSVNKGNHKHYIYVVDSPRLVSNTASIPGISESNTPLSCKVNTIIVYLILVIVAIIIVASSIFIRNTRHN